MNTLMLSPLFLVSMLAQVDATIRPSVLGRVAAHPTRNLTASHQVSGYKFVGRHYGRREAPGGNTEAGLFAYSVERDRWVRITAISTAQARLGTSRTSDPEALKRLRSSNVGWDFTPFRSQAYVPQPLLTSGSIAFPDAVEFDETTQAYRLRYFSLWKIKTAETVLVVRRADLDKLFESTTTP